MLTAEQVLALAPDPSSAKSGRDLATRRKWVSVARHGDVAIWGECQGSGSSPYQTVVDLGEPAFKCSCPSRKFPCKHGIGLLMLFATDTAAFAETAAPPAWVTTWLESRAERAEKQAAKKAEQAEKPVDPVAQAKRIMQREERVQAGLDDIEQWLRDLVRRGLANVDLGYKFFDAAAARLVDSQAPGLARMVREMSGIPSSGAGWQDRLVERLGLLYLAIQGYRRLWTAESGNLPNGAEADLRTIIGWTYSQEEVLAGEGVADRWSVLAQHVEEDDRLQVQRTWLQGERTGRSALILQFAHGSLGFSSGDGSAALAPGTAFDGDLAFFPSAYPLRALLKSRANDTVDIAIAGHPTISAAIDSYSRAVACFPWLDRYPITLADVVPSIAEGRWQIVDSENTSMPISPRFASGWRLLALSGGHPVTICGEWNGIHLLPLSVICIEAGKRRYTSLT
jgi:hypothetical protein